jgi:hypothetical protein
MQLSPCLVFLYYYHSEVGVIYILLVVEYAVVFVVNRVSGT